MSSQVKKQIEDLLYNSYNLKSLKSENLRENFLSSRDGLLWYKSNIVNVKPLKERLKETKSENIISEWDLKL